MKEGQLTLRISKKNNRDKPKILRQVGRTDTCAPFEKHQAVVLADIFEASFLSVYRVRYIRMCVLNLAVE